MEKLTAGADINKASSLPLWLRSIAMNMPQRRKMNSLDSIHILWMAGFLLSAILLATALVLPGLASSEWIEAMTWLTMGSFLSWLVFDLIKPAIRVGKSYILFHHSIALLSAGVLLSQGYLLLFLFGLILQEGYTLVFRKLIYAPGLELAFDLVRFMIGGALFYWLLQIEVPIYITCPLIFFAINNIYFFRSTHKAAFAQLATHR